MKFRKSLVPSNKLVVVKLSSLAVTLETGGIDSKQIVEIISDICQIITAGHCQVILVSSGAVNAGRPHINITKNGDISELQASAAVGQPILMRAFQTEFSKSNISCAQVLLTHEDLKSRPRSHNVRASIFSLLSNNVVPIVNENDCVSFDEITVGDNDQLSAMICEIVNAGTLCMLTTSDGLYDKDPSQSDAIQIPTVDYSASFDGIELISKSSAGRGGMKTKLQAVRKLTPLGVDVIICSFRFSSPVVRGLTEQVGTLFLGNPNRIPKKKSWILTRARNHASIRIDSGAKNALNDNASLLAIGIVSTEGKFGRGDSIQIVNNGDTIAFGITEYSDREIEKMKGMSTSELSKFLDYLPSKVVVHKDNLVLQKGI